MRIVQPLSFRGRSSLNPKVTIDAITPAASFQPHIRRQPPYSAVTYSLCCIIYLEVHAACMHFQIDKNTNSTKKGKLYAQHTCIVITTLPRLFSNFSRDLRLPILMTIFRIPLVRRHAHMHVRLFWHCVFLLIISNHSRTRFSSIHLIPHTCIV